MHYSVTDVRDALYFILISVFIHVDNVAVGPTCFFSFFPFFFNTSKNFKVVLSFFLNVLRSILM